MPGDVNAFPWSGVHLRARRTQAVVLTVVVALLVTFAALLPLATTSISRALVDDQVKSLGALGRTVEVQANSDNRGAIAPSTLAPLMGSQWDRIAGPAIAQMRTKIGLPNRDEHQISLVWRDGFCAHVRFSSGSCPTARAQVAVSAQSAGRLNLRVGSRVLMLDSSQNTRPGWTTHRMATVTGIFTQLPDESFWRGISVDKVSRIKQMFTHTWLTPKSTFDGPKPVTNVAGPTAESPPGQGWVWVATTVSRELTPGIFDYDQLPRGEAALAQTNSMISRQGSPTLITEQISTVRKRVSTDLDQIKVIAPLLLAQLVALQLLLVWIVLRSYITSRRSEIALIRLRGSGRRGGRRLVLGELSPPVLVGVPLGLVGAYAIDWISRHTWLPSSTKGGWSWWALVAALSAGLVAWLLLWWTTERTLRQPIGTLLRGVPPRSKRWALSPWEAVVLALAIGMLVTVATQSLTGAPVLVTPLVIATAVGLIVGGLLAPLGNRLIAGLMRRGRVDAVLGVAGVARRPHTKQVILAVTAAGAMVTFAASTLTLGDANRQDAAEVEVGAPVRITAIDTTGTLGTSGMLQAAKTIDPKRAHLTPVIRIQSGGSDGPVTLAGDPAAMARITRNGSGQNPWVLLERAAPVSSGYPAVVADWSQPSADATFAAPALSDQDQPYRRLGSVPFIGGAGAHTFITDLNLLLKDNTRSDSTTGEIWSDGTRPDLDDRARSALKSAGYEVDTTTLAGARHDRDASASAYGLKLAILVAAGALLVAVLVMIAVQNASAAARSRDQRALLKARVARSTLRSGSRVEAVLLAAPVLLGGAIGWLGAYLAAPSVPWYTTDPPYPVAQTTPPYIPALLALVVTALIVTAVALRTAGLRKVDS